MAHGGRLKALIKHPTTIPMHLPIRLKQDVPILMHQSTPSSGKPIRKLMTENISFKMPNTEKHQYLQENKAHPETHAI